MSVLVVTGTSTDVGKTIVTAALAVAFTAAGREPAVLKPAQTGVGPGEEGDLRTVERLAGVRGAEIRRFPEPLAPDVAARRSGIPGLRRVEILDAVRRLSVGGRDVLVEGAGGVLVRLGEEGVTIRDVAADLDAPVLVVTGAGLGSLNHAELTVEALRHSGVECAGLVIGSLPSHPDLATRCNLEDLPRVTGVPLLGRIPEGAGAFAPSRFVAEAPGWFAPGITSALLR